MAELKKVLTEAERNGLLELCKIGNVIWAVSYTHLTLPTKLEV